MSRILIVEDEVAIADLEKDYLELSGFEVEIENEGDKGLRRSLEEEFDLIILDLMLPAWMDLKSADRSESIKTRRSLWYRRRRTISTRSVDLVSVQMTI